MKVRHIKRRTSGFEMPLPERMTREAVQALPGVALARTKFSDFGYRFDVAVQCHDGSRVAVVFFPRRHKLTACCAPGYKGIRQIVRKLQRVVER